MRFIIRKIILKFCLLICSIISIFTILFLENINTNCPYPMIQYYSWNILNESEETVTMNYWGQISSTGTCTVLIVGTYNLNSRVRLYITLIIE